MPSIESTGYPLAFKVAEGSGSPGDTLTFETRVRSLEGMQKEALVTSLPDGASWRLACDEGPYLNGKDMAPFPLGFFSAGMQFCFLSQFLQGARAQRIPIEDVSLEEDNYFTMEGSFLRGDARGGAKPAELRLKVASKSDPAQIAKLARLAERSSPTQSLMRVPLDNSFSVALNGERVPDHGLTPSPSPMEEDPAMAFEDLAPGTAASLPEIITRVKKVEAVHGVDGGAGSSLKAEQKRTLHMRGVARPLEGLLMETRIDLFKPLGSSYRFVCDEIEANGGRGMAPPPLAYVSAGVGFCFMTQLGRYAKITKQPLRAYRIAQRTVFPFEGSLADGSRRGAIGPVDTQTFLDADDTDDADASRLVEMGQQTCFLHASMVGEYPSRLTVEVNGEEIS